MDAPQPIGVLRSGPCRRSLLRARGDVTPRITAITKKHIPKPPGVGFPSFFHSERSNFVSALDEIAAVVIGASGREEASRKGKTPKPDLRKRKTGKKKDEDGNPDAEPKETAEVRLVETRAAPAPDVTFLGTRFDTALTRP